MPLDTFDARELNIDTLRVASPCSVSWDAMTGDERVRHCATCSLDVFDASYLSADEMRTLLANRLPGQRLCMKLYRRADGTIMTRDCPVGARRRRLRILAAIAAGLGALAVGVRVAYEHALGTSPPVSLRPYEPSGGVTVMGDVSLPAAPTPLALGSNGPPAPGSGTDDLDR